MKITSTRPQLRGTPALVLSSLVLAVSACFTCAASAQTAPANPPAAPAEKKPVEGTAKPAADAKTDAKADADKPAQAVDKIEVKASASAYDARENDTATKIVVTSEEIKKYGDTQILDVITILVAVSFSRAS